jgi:dinuclear metal center YbgI/SA1388 family protein
VHANADLDAIVAWLDQHLDAARFRASEPDANGLIVRAGPGVTKIGVAVSASFAAIGAAAKAGVQLLVVHHPTWPAVDLHLYDEKKQMCELAGVSLYAAHASLDCAPEVGNGWVLARLLGLEVECTFMEYHGGDAGVIARCDVPLRELVARASRELRVEVEAHEHAKTCARVAIVPGAGGMTGDLDQARQLGADTYLTGEGSMFTRMFAKECGMNLLFGTHYATEAPGIRALGERLSEQAGVPVEFFDESPDVF